MFQYVLKRLGQGALLVIAVSMAVFMLMHLMPGDPVDSLVSESVSDERKQEYRVAWGLDQPLPVQYVKWVERVLQGDLGLSLGTGMNVLDTIRSRMPLSLKLCGLAMLMQLIVSVPLGLVAAYRKGGWFDRFIMGYSMVTAAIPTFWIGMVLILLFGVTLKALPVSGFKTWRHFVLPVTAMVLGGVSSNIRLMRSEVLAVAREKYVNTAVAKGLSRRQVMVRHVLRNAMILIVVQTFMSLPWIVAGAVIMENVFSIPGMGALMASAVISQDFPVVQACILIISVLTVLANLISDILTAVLDPRIRASISGGSV